MQMTLLQIVQRAYREYGLAGSGPVSVLNQSGRNSDVVEWVKSAYEEIQLERPDWNFLWGQVTANLTANVDTYDPTAAPFGISNGVRAFAQRLGASYIYPTAQGVNGRLFMRFLPWEEFCKYIVPPVTGSMPTVFTLRPDGDLQYYPKPTAACTAVHEYWKNPATFTPDDADVPILPAWAHMAIVWKAVMIGCGKTQNWARFDTAEEEYMKIRSRLGQSALPQITHAGPLA